MKRIPTPPGVLFGIDREICESARRKKTLNGIAQLPLVKLRAHMERQSGLQLRARERLARRFKADTRDRQPFILKCLFDWRGVLTLKSRAWNRKEQQRRYGC